MGKRVRRAQAQARAKHEAQASGPHWSVRLTIALFCGFGLWWAGHHFGCEELVRGWEFVGAAVTDKILFVLFSNRG